MTVKNTLCAFPPGLRINPDIRESDGDGLITCAFGSKAGPYLSGCWETCARERWRACGMRSTASADPFLLLKMRLQSDTVTIHPATPRTETTVSEHATQPPTLSTVFFSGDFTTDTPGAAVFFLPLGGKYS